MKRNFIGIIAALCSLFAIPAQAELRYIFYFIGDGMGFGQVATTDMFNRLTDPAGRQLTMTQLPVSGAVTTFSASSPVTDSAAAGTALATGRKTNNGMIGMTPDSVAAKSIAMQLMECGFGTGIISSNSPDDATPAAFYGHAPKRYDQYAFNCQAATSSVDFIGGANLRGLKTKDGEPTDVLSRCERANVAVAYGLDELAKVTRPKVILLNQNRELNNTLGLAIDSLENTLTLPELTRACLSWLEAHRGDRFFMMVESGMIDWLSHGNDTGGLVREMNRFDQTIDIAMDFYRQHPDETLIIVTADHDTGGLAFGNNFRKADLRLLANQRVSKEAFSQRIKSMLLDKRIYAWDDMEQMLRRDYGFWDAIALSDDETNQLKTAFETIFANKNVADQKTLYASYNQFAVLVHNILDNHVGVGWTSLNHTGNYVPLFAIGVGAERFAGLKDNTDIPKTIYSIVDSFTPAPRIIK